MTANGGTVPNPAFPRSLRRIAARSGDTLTILVKGDTNLISMVVDGDGPEISSVAPAHGTIQDSEVLRISFTASDELSGLRHDAEQVLSEGPHYPDGDGDPTVSNLDKDNFESGEPISDIDGRSTDINVWYGTDEGRERGRVWHAVTEAAVRLPRSGTTE